MIGKAIFLAMAIVMGLYFFRKKSPDEQQAEQPLHWIDSTNFSHNIAYRYDFNEKVIQLFFVNKQTRQAENYFVRFGENIAIEKPNEYSLSAKPNSVNDYYEYANLNIRSANGEMNVSTQILLKK